MGGLKHFIYKNIIKKIPFIERQYELYKGLSVSTKKTARDIEKFYKNLSASKMAFANKKRVDDLIVSFTSFPARIANVEYTLFSLIQQTIRPEKIILWLSEAEFPEKNIPDNLKKYYDFGFEVQFVKENYKSYKKIFYILKIYHYKNIVTADDDIFYKPDWLELLYNTHISFPNDIIAHRAHNISFNNKKIESYKDWNGENGEVSYLNFLTSGGGVLYPPGSLYKDVVNYELFLKLCPYADDIWLYVMALLQKTKIRLVKNGYSRIISFDYIFEKYSKNIPQLMDINVHNNQNDIQLKSVLEYYNIYDSFYELYNDRKE